MSLTMVLLIQRRISGIICFSSAQYQEDKSTMYQKEVPNQSHYMVLSNALIYVLNICLFLN